MYWPRPTALAPSRTFGGLSPSALPLSTNQSAAWSLSPASADLVPFRLRRAPHPRRTAALGKSSP
eukprot:3101069-Alexandrium_andersonii.AAC.1